MAKRRQKSRTHVTPSEDELKSIPKSLVIRVGETSMGNHSLNQLVKDFRNIMQPHTAVKLKERKSNKLKDFVVMCGPLGVSHLFIFTQSEKTGNVSLKVARTPQGPAITFRVLDYSLGKDIKRFLRRPKSLAKEDVLHPPLLVLNGFDIKNEDENKANVEKVVVSMFQNIFPPINPARTELSSIRRVFMINKDRELNEISLRHYVIDVREVEISKNLKKLYRSKKNLHKTVPNLSKKEDIASLIFDHDIGAYTSDSEVDDDAIVSVIDKKDTQIKFRQPNEASKPAPVADDDRLDSDVEMEDATNETGSAEHADLRPRKRAIKLTEVGPRLTLKLVKIEEGIFNGKVLHHEFIHKTDHEIKALEKKHLEKLKLKEQRKKEQEENIARKKAAKEAKKQRKLERRQARKLAEANGTAKENESSSSSSDSSDGEYSDVPEDLDSDLLSEIEN
ncbi:HBR336Wp [Eremothecium sinecaudum]|uniref:HBR336Wp n=1 Tax=Eremothecium sinecaudum TaxID=45286 RepID=A0A109UY21_9SACH|nr:HBR336Wp [Eremothecium sinecaudum]AMD19237.1 HBR336Wp [Eremothecium sinecaudum]